VLGRVSKGTRNTHDNRKMTRVDISESQARKAMNLEENAMKM
jgi:hypothetical protein